MLLIVAWLWGVLLARASHVEFATLPFSPELIVPAIHDSPENSTDRALLVGRVVSLADAKSKLRDWLQPFHFWLRRQKKNGLIVFGSHQFKVMTVDLPRALRQASSSHIIERVVDVISKSNPLRLYQGGYTAPCSYDYMVAGVSDHQSIHTAAVLGTNAQWAFTKIRIAVLVDHLCSRSASDKMASIVRQLTEPIVGAAESPTDSFSAASGLHQWMDRISVGRSEWAGHVYEVQSIKLPRALRGEQVFDLTQNIRRRFVEGGDFAIFTTRKHPKGEKSQMVSRVESDNSIAIAVVLREGPDGVAAKTVLLALPVGWSLREDSNAECTSILRLLDA